MMGRRHRTWVIVLAVMVALTPTVDAQATASVRSGTIVVAYRAPWLLEGTPNGCHGSFDCFAWLQACREPAPGVGLSASIVDVRSLAGSAKTRQFTIVDSYDGLGSPDGVAVEFWDRFCRRIRLPEGELDRIRRAEFKIPEHARWMTVANGRPTWGPGGSLAGVVLEWELK